MSLVVAAVFLILGIVTLAICGGFITNAAAKISGIPNYDQNPRLNNARTDAIWASVISWITIALIIVIVIFYIYYSGKNMGIINDIVTYSLFFITLAAVIIVGILSATTASNIHNSGVADNNSSYTNAIVAAVLGIVVFVLLLIAFIIRITYRVKKIYHEKTGKILNMEEINRYRQFLRPREEINTQIPIVAPVLSQASIQQAVVAGPIPQQAVVAASTPQSSDIFEGNIYQAPWKRTPYKPRTYEEVVADLFPEGIPKEEASARENVPRRRDYNSEAEYVKAWGQKYGYQVPDFLANIGGNISAKAREDFFRRNPEYAQEYN